MITRADGTQFFVHPGHSNRKIRVWTLDGHDPPIDPPKKGMGYSEGPGTFRGFLTTQQNKQLSFDPRKEPQEPQWRSQQMGPDAEAKTEPVENTGSSVEAEHAAAKKRAVAPEHREPAERTKEEESTEAGSSTVADLSSMD